MRTTRSCVWSESCAAGASSAGRCRPKRSWRPLNAPRSVVPARARQDVSRWSTCCVRAHVASRSSSSSDWRKEAFLDAATSRLSSATTSVASSTSAPARGWPDPIRSRAIATSFTRRAHAPPGASTSYARLLPTKAVRARRVLSGTRCSPSFPGTTWRAGPDDVHSRTSPGRSRMLQPNASVYAPSRSAPPPTGLPRRRSRWQTAGIAGWRVPCAHSSARPGSRTHRSSPTWGHGRRSASRSSSALRTARRSGSSSG